MNDHENVGYNEEEQEFYQDEVIENRKHTRMTPGKLLEIEAVQDQIIEQKIKMSIFDKPFGLRKDRNHTFKTV